jgi:hypothetical protein
LRTDTTVVTEANCSLQDVAHHDGGARRSYRHSITSSAPVVKSGAIAHQLDQAATVARKDRLEPLFAMLLQAGKRAVLIPAHQPRVANDIRRKNCRQSPYNPLAGQKASPKATRPGGS